MKHTALLSLALGLLASASSLAAEPAPVIVQATPLLDIPQETVVGCLTVKKEEKRLFRKKSTLVSSQCFRGVVSNEKDQLSPAVIDAQTIRTEVRRDVSYLQSSSHTKSQQVTFSEGRDAVASSDLQIEPAVYEDIVTLTPGVVSEGVTTALQFNRKPSGALNGNLKLSIKEIDSIQDYVPPTASPVTLQLPQSTSIDFEGNFTQPFSTLKHGPYLISLDFKVLPIGQAVSDEDLKSVKAP